MSKLQSQNIVINYVDFDGTHTVKFNESGHYHDDKDPVHKTGKTLICTYSKENGVSQRVYIASMPMKANTVTCSYQGHEILKLTRPNLPYEQYQTTRGEDIIMSYDSAHQVTLRNKNDNTEIWSLRSCLPIIQENSSFDSNKSVIKLHFAANNTGQYLHVDGTIAWDSAVNLTGLETFLD
jgi:hypothetical protein